MRKLFHVRKSGRGLDPGLKIGTWGTRCCGYPKELLQVGLFGFFDHVAFAGGEKKVCLEAVLAGVVQRNPGPRIGTWGTRCCGYPKELLQVGLFGFFDHVAFAGGEKKVCFEAVLAGVVQRNPGPRIGTWGTRICGHSKECFSGLRIGVTRVVWVARFLRDAVQCDSISTMPSMPVA